jgi:hypothetical protein
MSDRDEMERTVGTVAPLRRARTTKRTVYDEIGEILADRGWVQGVERRGRALSLRAAIGAAVGIGVPGGSAPDGATLARAGRIGAHLRDLTGARNLDAWSDARERTVDDILRLLASAAVGFEDD